eukprot:scaffold1511_cov170-Amphora_coffeaeformis.AAC.13
MNGLSKRTMQPRRDHLSLLGSLRILEVEIYFPETLRQRLARHFDEGTLMVLELKHPGRASHPIAVQSTGKVSRALYQFLTQHETYSANIQALELIRVPTAFQKFLDRLRPLAGDLGTFVSFKDAFNQVIQ